jgi:hypothetical protein
LGISLDRLVSRLHRRRAGGAGYRSMGVTWPDSRYLVIGLSGEVDSNSRHRQIQTVGGWQCRYDLKTGKFDVPPDFAENNAKSNCSRLGITISSIYRPPFSHDG